MTIKEIINKCDNEICRQIIRDLIDKYNYSMNDDVDVLDCGCYDNHEWLSLYRVIEVICDVDKSY